MGRFFEIMKKYSLKKIEPDVSTEIVYLNKIPAKNQRDSEEGSSPIESGNRTGSTAEPSVRNEKAAKHVSTVTRELQELQVAVKEPLNALIQKNLSFANTPNGKAPLEGFRVRDDEREKQSLSPTRSFKDTDSEKQVSAYRAISEKFAALREEYAKSDFRRIGPQKSISEKRGKNELIVMEKPESMISQSIKIIRTRLLYLMQERRIRTVLVTSCNPAEGKSFFSSNIAISIAKGFDEYVLLVDADLRKPSLHEIYEVPLNPGLTDFLIDPQNELGDVMTRTDIGKLSLLTAGSMYEGSSELLNSDLMAMFLQGLKVKYDNRYIILDSPPLLISEALSLSHWADGIVLVVDIRKTSRDIVREAIQQIEKDKLIGIIMNNCDFNMKKYKYYGSIYKSHYYEQYRANLKHQRQSVEGLRK